MEEQERPLNTFSRYLVLFVVSEIAIFVGVAVVCLVGGWNTLNDYATGLFIAGAVVIGIGGAIVMGSNRYTGDLTTRYIETVHEEDGKTRLHRYQRENESSRLFALKAFMIGIIPFVTSIGLSIVPMMRQFWVDQRPNYFSSRIIAVPRGRLYNRSAPFSMVIVESLNKSVSSASSRTPLCQTGTTASVNVSGPR
jgi:hypothetical protein